MAVKLKVELVPKEAHLLVQALQLLENHMLAVYPDGPGKALELSEVRSLQGAFLEALKVAKDQATAGKLKPFVPQTPKYKHPVTTCGVCHTTKPAKDGVCPHCGRLRP